MVVPDGVRMLAARQHAVVTTSQCGSLGVPGSWVDRRVRDGAWQRLHPGVLVTHSGPIAWRTRAQAALLHAGTGAALSHRSAAYLHEIVAHAPDLVEVVVPHRRRVTGSAGLRVYRRRDMPPAFGRLRTVDRPHTVLDLLAMTTSDDDAVGLLCDAVRGGTWPDQVLAAAGRRTNLPRRAVALELLALVDDGIESPLELRYHRDVEARHGLPTAQLQVRARIDGYWIRADRLYAGLGVRIELDGVLAHTGVRADRDVWRDNAVVIQHDELTLRYRWRHVRVDPCTTARQVGLALRSRGWDGAPRRCSPSCTARTNPDAT